MHLESILVTSAQVQRTFGFWMINGLDPFIKTWSIPKCIAPNQNFYKAMRTLGGLKPKI